MYLANYNQDGNILGFYIVGMHVNIPEPTLEVTAEQHQEYFDNGQNYKIIDGQFVYVEPVIVAQTKAQKLTALNAKYDPIFIAYRNSMVDAEYITDVTAREARKASITIERNASVSAKAAERAVIMAG